MAKRTDNFYIGRTHGCNPPTVFKKPPVIRDGTRIKIRVWKFDHGFQGRCQEVEIIERVVRVRGEWTHNTIGALHRTAMAYVEYRGCCYRVSCDPHDLKMPWRIQLTGP